MENKTSFSLTTGRRPWWQRTTVFGWLGLAVLAAFALLIVAQAARGTLRWWQGRQWSSAETAARAADPNPTPSSAQVGAAAQVSPLATPGNTPVRPAGGAPWAARMQPDGAGGYLLPEDARAVLEDDYLQTVPYHGGPPWRLEDEVDGRSVIDLYASGPMQSGWQGRLHQLQAGTFPSPYVDVQYGQHLLQVQDCSVDGLNCYLGDLLRQATLGEYDVVNRRVLSEKPAEAGYDGTVILKVVYDLEDERWKLDEYVRWIPAPGQSE